MQIKHLGLGRALCEGMGIERDVDTMLIGDQPVGTWVLVFIDSAREILTPERAAQIEQAVKALDNVMAQQDNQQSAYATTNESLDTSLDAMFADLVGREPPKPPSLLALEAEQNTKAKTTARIPPTNKH